MQIPVPMFRALVRAFLTWNLLIVTALDVLKPPAGEVLDRCQQ
jgi:hypothetical protein